MIESAILSILRGDSALMTLLGGNELRVDLLTIEEPATAPFLTFNVSKSTQAGRPSLCAPASLGLLQTTVMLTPWAQTADQVQSIHAAARAALLAVQRQTVDGVSIQSITWQSYEQWAQDEATHLMTRGQVFLIAHTE